MKRDFLELLYCPYSKSPLAFDAFETQADEVLFGVLRSEAGEFPIIAGIPVLFFNKRNLIDLVRNGRYQDAVVLAMIGPAPVKGFGRLTKCSEDSENGEGIGNWFEGVRQALWVRKAKKLFFPPTSQTSLTPPHLFDLGYGRYQLKKSGFVAYNFYRFSSPSYLTALSFVQTIEGSRGRTLDLACGAGHVTWAIQRRIPHHPVIGLDRSFFALYVARTWMVPDAWLVCGDANALPFRDQLFDHVFSSDAFYFFPNKWGSLKEIERVLTGSGFMLLTGLRNALTAKERVGEPYSPQGYRRLVSHLLARLIPDTLTVHRYLDGHGVEGEDQVDDQTLDQAFALTIWAGKRRVPFANHGPFPSWPHAHGILGINPLYLPARSNNAGTVYLRQFPKGAYLNINPQVREYLPNLFSFTSEQAMALQQNSPEGLESLISRCAVMGFPSGYLD